MVRFGPFELDAATRQLLRKLSGVITDQSGAAIANAAVILTHTQTHAKREATTDGQGHFDFSELPTGDYFIEVKMPGFAPRRELARIEPGEHTQRNIRLRLGFVTETIVVAGIGMPTMNQMNLIRHVDASARRAFAETIQLPSIMKRVQPEYPQRLHDAGVQGSVTLEGQISRDGTVTNLEVVPPANEDLARAALDAVHQWRYEPTRLHGVPVDINVSITIDFQSRR